MIKVAITGNIAAGKSQVEKYLTDKGYIVYDADIIAHNILDEMTDFYGYDVFTDGKINRQKLGELVFSNPNIKQKLEGIMHPKIKDEIKRLFEKHKTENFIFISVPLLFEAGFENLFDKILMIKVDPNIQLERLKLRNNFSAEQAKCRINSQDNQDLKLQKADYIISNDGTLDDLQKEIDTFLACIKL